MAAARKERAEEDLVAEAARRAMADADGDVQSAARMLETAVRAQSRLRDALMNPLVSGACWDAVRKQVRLTRKSVWERQDSREPRPGAALDHISRVVQLAAGTLLMFPLPGGKPLGQATREDIAQAAEFYERQAGDMAIKARWLRLVGQSVPDGKSVGAVLTDKRLRELQAEARRHD